MVRALGWLFGAVLCAACTVEPVDLAGRECPCIHGWVCDPVLSVCVEVGTTEDAGRHVRGDAGMEFDAARLDARSAVDGSAASVDASVAVDAPTTDGGTARPDAPPADAPPDGGAAPSGCTTAHASRPFCDGFESGDLGMWGGEWTPDGSSVSVIDSSEGPVYRGAHALHARGVVGSDAALVYTVALSPTSATDYWLRAYYYFPSSTDLQCEFTSQLDLDDNHLINAYASDTRANVHSHGLVTDVSEDQSTPPARDRWVCVEVHVAADASAGTIELYFDGTRVVHTPGIDATLVRPLQGIEVGVVWKDEPDPPQELYVDEVVADTSRIGCD